MKGFFYLGSHMRCAGPVTLPLLTKSNMTHLEPLFPLDFKFSVYVCSVLAQEGQFNPSKTVFPS